MKDLKLSPSSENYLEAILRLERKNKVARVKDIADALNVQMPSVSSALKKLKELNLISYQKNSFITLTQDGMDIAEKIDTRHRFLSCFFQDLLFLPKEKAEDEACAIEHVISKETSDRLLNMIEYLSQEYIEKGDDTKESWKQVMTRNRSD